MRKMLFGVLAVMAAVFAISFASAEEWKPDMNAPLVRAQDLPADVATGGGAIDIKPAAGGDRLEITFYDAKVTSKGGGPLLNPEVVRVASGVLHAAKTAGDKRVASEYVAEKTFTNGGDITVTLNNYAKSPGVPVVEGLWGIGKAKGDSEVKFLVLNPASVWVNYDQKSDGSPNMETLLVNFLMCPDGKIMPAKALGKGKIKQGKHPELADACK